MSLPNFKGGGIVSVRREGESPHRAIPEDNGQELRSKKCSIGSNTSAKMLTP